MNALATKNAGSFLSPSREGFSLKAAHFSLSSIMLFSNTSSATALKGLLSRLLYWRNNAE